MLRSRLAVRPHLVALQHHDGIPRRPLRFPVQCAARSICRTIVPEIRDHVLPRRRHTRGINSVPAMPSGSHPQTLTAAVNDLPIQLNQAAGAAHAKRTRGTHSKSRSRCLIGVPAPSSSIVRPSNHADPSPGCAERPKLIFRALRGEYRQLDRIPRPLLARSPHGSTCCRTPGCRFHRSTRHQRPAYPRVTPVVLMKPLYRTRLAEPSRPGTTRRHTEARRGAARVSRRSPERSSSCMASYVPGDERAPRSPSTTSDVCMSNPVNCTRLTGGVDHGAHPHDHSSALLRGSRQTSHRSRRGSPTPVKHGVDASR